MEEFIVMRLNVSQYFTFRYISLPFSNTGTNCVIHRQRHMYDNNGNALKSIQVYSQMKTTGVFLSLLILFISFINKEMIDTRFVGFYCSMYCSYLWSRNFGLDPSVCPAMSQEIKCCEHFEFYNAAVIITCTMQYAWTKSSQHYVIYSFLLLVSHCIFDIWV